MVDANARGASPPTTAQDELTAAQQELAAAEADERRWDQIPALKRRVQELRERPAGGTAVAGVPSAAAGSDGGTTDGRSALASPFLTATGPAGPPEPTPPAAGTAGTDGTAAAGNGAVQPDGERLGIRVD